MIGWVQIKEVELWLYSLLVQPFVFLEINIVFHLYGAGNLKLACTESAEFFCVTAVCKKVLILLPFVSSSNQHTGIAALIVVDLEEVCGRLKESVFFKWLVLDT